MDKKVSIIVPIYNASAYLRECLESIRKQSSKDWSCILVNDGSTDNSQSIIDEYCALDDRFVGVYKQNENSCGKAKCYGVKQAKTDFVLILDADDLLGDDDYVEKLLKRQRKTNADSVISRFCCFENEDKDVVWSLPNDGFDLSQVVDGESACLLTIPNWQIGLNGSLIRRVLYEGSFPFSEGEWANLDEVRGREVLIKCKSVAFSDANYYYRKNPASITRAISPILFDRSINDAVLVRFAQKFFPQNKVLINDLAHKHFSMLRTRIVDYENIKDKLSIEECNRVEKALAQSYHLMDIRLLMKRRLKWGMIVVLLRRYSWFRHLVVFLNSFLNSYS